ncbi:hypothetical protein J6590_024169 [Homalodisca vitripennis]|nr:hypothetical protein J6590_024169 [Homalodisca vitripennis]
MRVNLRASLPPKSLSVTDASHSGNRFVYTPLSQCSLELTICRADDVIDTVSVSSMNLWSPTHRATEYIMSESLIRSINREGQSGEQGVSECSGGVGCVLPPPRSGGARQSYTERESDCSALCSTTCVIYTFHFILRSRTSLRIRTTETPKCVHAQCRTQQYKDGLRFIPPRVVLDVEGSPELMAPRRHHHNGLMGVEVVANMDPDTIENHDPNVTRCCVPSGECLRGFALISLDDLRETVKVTCNNDSCTAGRYMHRECFEAWEQTVLTYLKSCGRARSWSERQRHQNLWTKKGYDLAFKACGCKCGRGHLKKDLDWVPPPPGFGVRDDDASKKKKRRNKNTRPTLAVSAHHNGQHRPTEAQTIDPLRARAGSLSSSNGSSSPPASASSVSPVHNNSTKKKSKFVEFFSDRKQQEVRLVKFLGLSRPAHKLIVA